MFRNEPREEPTPDPPILVPQVAWPVAKDFLAPPWNDGSYVFIFPSVCIIVVIIHTDSFLPILLE
jgi:hypothetical protein